MVQDTAHGARRKKLARVLEAFRHEKTDPEIFREMGEWAFSAPLSIQIWRRWPRLGRLRDCPRG